MQAMEQNAAELTQFNPQTAAQAAKLSHLNGKRKKKPKRTHTITQGTELQEALHRAGKRLDEDMPKVEDRSERARIACALASVAKGWQSMTDQLRILAGKPLPGSRRPPPDQPKKPKAQSAPKLVLPEPEPIPPEQPK